MYYFKDVDKVHYLEHDYDWYLYNYFYDYNNISGVKEKYNKYYVKVKGRSHEKRFMTNEIVMLESLNNSGLTPSIKKYRFFEYKIYYDGDDCYSYYYFSYIVMENKGKSLLELYFDEDQYEEFSGPGCTSDEFIELPEIREQFFPSDIISNKTTTRIFELIKRLDDLGYYHQDIHAGNILEDENGDLCIIDLESSLKK